MRPTIKHLRTLTAAAALSVASTGCAGMGPLSDVLGGVITPPAPGGELSGEVRYVDPRSQEIGLRTEDGRSGGIAYDSRTRVVFQEREFPVTALEEGDHVSMRVQQDAQGALYTDVVYVQRNVRDMREPYAGDGVAGEVIQGSVGRVEPDRGRFELRTAMGNGIVALAYSPRAADRDRFGRLRTGDTVRVEVERVGEGRYEVIRFL